jgi:FMN phosphatase YigB (HAD superfamily)
MSGIKIISFDLEGTLTTSDFSQAVWYEGIPSLYSERNSISFEEAKNIVQDQYREVGEKKLEWYDIKYWFNLFNLEGYQRILNRYANRICVYPDVIPALSTLEKDYKLIISTNSTREFVPYLLNGIEKYFLRVFSSVSDYDLIKCPQFYLTICHEMCVQVNEIAHIGDSWEFDVIASQSAGMKALYLNRSQKSHAFTSVSDLKDLIDKLNNI